MLIRRDEIDFDALLAIMQTQAGLLELGLSIVSIVLAIYLAKASYKHWFSEHPERYERFLPYVIQRLVLPVSAQLMVILMRVVWLQVSVEKSLLLPVISIMLFALTVVRVCCAILHQALPKGRFERHSEKVLASVLWLGFVSWLIGFDEEVVSWLEAVSFSVGASKLNLLMIINALLWVSVIVVVALWISRLIESRLMHLQHLAPNLRIVFSKLARSLLLVVAVMIALPVVGIDLTVLSVFGGAVGLGLGFGLQKIASNFISGFIILLDHSIRIGDRLTVDNRTGYVTKITSRYVVLKSGDGSESLIPNDIFMTSTVVNQSYSDKSMWASINVQVAYGTDLDLALQLLEQAAKQPRVLSTPAPKAVIVEFADNGVSLELGFWVADPENGFGSLKSDIQLALWHLFIQNGIDIPSPQREVRLIDAHAASGKA